MTEALEMPADAAMVMRSETQRAQAKLTPRENFGFQFSLSKANSLSYVHLAAGPDKRFPSLGIDLASEENFDFPGEMLRFCGARWRLRMNACAPPEQPRGDDARIVEHQEFVTSQEIGKFSKEAVLEKSLRTIQGQQPRGFATVGRTPW